MVSLNKKDAKFRDEALHGNMWAVIFKVCFPLAIYQAISQIFNVVDTLMASHISAEAVSTVAYLVQFNNFIAAIGTGLAVSGSIKISRAYGKGDYDEVRKLISTVIAMTIILSLLALIIIPLTPFILRVTGTPEAFISLGSTYFAITTASVIINFFNTVYLSIEKTRGKSKKILALNALCISIKISLTAIFVYVLNGSIIYIAIASLISNLSIFIISIINLASGDDVFAFHKRAVQLNKETVLPIIKLAFPSMLEKMAFCYGKGMVNKMASSYDEKAVGAAGISNNMSGMITGWQLGLQDGASALEGQINGSGDKERTIRMYRRIQLISLLIGLIGFSLFSVISPYIAHIFASSRSGNNAEFQTMIITIFHYEMLGCLFLSFHYPAVSLLLSFGKTKLTLLINFLRIFVFRVPVIYAFLKLTTLGYIAVGYTMTISNTLTGIFGLILAEIVLRRECYPKREQAHSSL